MLVLAFGIKYPPSGEGAKLVSKVVYFGAWKSLGPAARLVSEVEAS
jgi:hypothetical protein